MSPALRDSGSPDSLASQAIAAHAMASITVPIVLVDVIAAPPRVAGALNAPNFE
jgi:hypothetical protein